VDHRFNDNHRLFARYVIVPSTWVNNPLMRPTAFTSEFRAQNIGVGYSWVISPTKLNDLRVGYNRIRANQVGLQTDTSFTHRDLGLDMRVTGDGNRTLTPREEGLPNISITNFASTGSGNVTFNTNETSEVADSLAINHGRHNFKFGGQWRNSPVVNSASNLPRGQLTFTGDIAGVPDGMAAFMLGIPLNANSAEGVPNNDIHQQKVGLYWLDDFKAASRLTINYGVRWDWFGAVTDAGGRIRNLSFAGSDVQTINGVRYPMLVPNPLVPKALYDINWKQIMPRLGIVYRLHDRTPSLPPELRAFLLAAANEQLRILQSNPPLWLPVFLERHHPPPTAPFRIPSRLAARQGSRRAGDARATSRRIMTTAPCISIENLAQWTAEIERSFRRMSCYRNRLRRQCGLQHRHACRELEQSGSGVGSVQGRRPVRQSHVDSRAPSVLLPLGTVHSLSRGRVPATAPQSVPKALLARPDVSCFVQFIRRGCPLAMVTMKAGRSGIRFSDHFRNRLGDYGRSQIDQRFRFVFSHVWEIPWMRSRNGPAGWFLGGWSVNGIIQLTSGLPVTVSQNGDAQNTGASSFQRPNIVTGQPVDRVYANRSLDQWFNTAALSGQSAMVARAKGSYLGPRAGATRCVPRRPPQQDLDLRLYSKSSARRPSYSSPLESSTYQHAAIQCSVLTQAPISAHHFTVIAPRNAVWFEVSL
jgi:hypothetical protein